MRLLLKIMLPVDTANLAVRKGTLGRVIETILKDTKAEAAYFGEEEGKRTAFVIVDIEGLHKLPSVAEPWFLAFNASIQVKPVMTLEDLRRAGPDLEGAAMKYVSQQC